MTDPVDSQAFRPGTLVTHEGGTYSLVYSDFPECDAFDEHGLQGGGYTWHGLVVHILEQEAPDALDSLEFDPEGSMFAVVSRDLEALRAVASALAKLEDPALLRKLASTLDLSEYD